MRWLSRFVLGAVVVSGSLLWAQDAGQKNASPAAGNAPASPSSSPSSPSSTAPSAPPAVASAGSSSSSSLVAGAAVCDPEKITPGSALTVVSDTSGVDLRQYLRDVMRTLMLNWHRALREDEGNSSIEKGCATVEFSIGRDGRLMGEKLEEPSGDAVLDRAAQTAVMKAAPFADLPGELAGDSLALRFRFRYNHRGQLMPVGPEGGLQAGSGGAAPGGVEPETYHGEPVYRPGRGATAPKGIYMPTAEFPERARRKKMEGVVTLQLVVTTEGTTDDVKVLHGADPDLDQRAVEAVQRWRFEPGMKDGKAVNMHINVEMSFKLY